MCGIAGIIAVDNNEINLQRLKKMTDIIAHRGPDGEGHWISDNGNVGLGHRRLSIIDLSNEADQPMHYFGRYSMVFNGEIYNYLELKETLLKQGYKFATASDTEVLLALYERDKEKCLQLLDGMFSFVIYDERENEIFAARDRFGEKPFFYNYVPGKHFLFGSEMKCLWAAGIEKKVSNRMLYNYLSDGFLENPEDISETFYENCTRLPHSHYIKLSVAHCKMTIRQYYDIDWKNADHNISIEAAKEKFHELFYTSVQRRLRSDVTVGSSLSGGLDSSLVVTVIDELKKGTNQQQDTFSAVFPGFVKDERKYMDYVIGKTNVSPHFITPEDEGLINNLEKLSWHQEEPYGSASIYVQYCVMQLAKENNVTVLLDGQGADEVLAGYHGYYPQYFAELKRQNKGLYKKEIDAYINMHANSAVNVNLVGSPVNRLKASIGNYTPLLRKWYHSLKYKKEPFVSEPFYNTYHKESFKRTEQFNQVNHSLYHSTLKHGLQELLRYADRNSMAFSREIRLPFLYHELVEFLFTLPPHMKIKNGWTKWIMRETFTKELPREITWRKDKIGYEPPQKDWMEKAPMQERMVAAKGTLLYQGIINKNIAERTIVPSEAGIFKNENWKQLMAATLFNDNSPL